MITFTDEQQRIVDYIMEQVSLGGGGKNVVVSGMGGVGKSEMITEIICMLLADGKKVAAGAMTGKATAVIRQKINQKLEERKMIWVNEKGVKCSQFPADNLLIETMQKITKTSRVVNLTEDGDTIYSNIWRDPKDFNFDILIVDELSMVPHYMAMWWQKTPALVVGLGDFCQLPEVTTEETQKELVGFKHDLKLSTPKFVKGYGVKVLKNLSQYELTRVLRSDNEIALLSKDLRDFNQSGSEIVGVIKKWAKKAPNVISYSTSLDKLETDPSWQIICYTNKLCNKINESLCEGDDYPTNNDKILLFDNIPPIGKYNGDTMTLDSLLKTVKEYNEDKRHRPITVVLKWKNRMPTKNSKHPLERQMFLQYCAFKKSIKSAQKERMDNLSGILDKSGYATKQIDKWKEDISRIRGQSSSDGECFSNVINSFYETDRDMMNFIMTNSVPLPLMYVVNIDYGYAITTHKSQGSEYEKVCYVLERIDRPLLYTGVSRAKKQLKVINLTKTT